MIHQHISKLGLPVKDKVTGFEGIVECVSFDLYGCIQVALRPSILDEKGMVKESRWFDISRLEILSDTPVMERPNFDQGVQAEGKQGPAEKMPYNR